MLSKEEIRAYVNLTKPRITLMVVVTAALGYFLAAQGLTDPIVFVAALAGTALAASGASVLNQYLERDVDARMNRTKSRPIPTGLIRPESALSFGVVLALGGCFLLLWQVNILCAFLALESTFLYVLVYTPMKRLSWLNTSIGAVPGAIPPLIGWAAAAGRLDIGAWVLFAILFLWQHPHFFSIAWMYREDYARGGLKMLPVVKPDGRSTFRQVIGFSVLLIPVSLLPTLMGMSSWLYFVGALALGVGMLAPAVAFARNHSSKSARTLLRASLVYLPILLALIVVDAALF